MAPQRPPAQLRPARTSLLARRRNTRRSADEYAYHGCRPAPVGSTNDDASKNTGEATAAAKVPIINKTHIKIVKKAPANQSATNAAAKTPIINKTTIKIVKSAPAHQSASSAGREAVARREKISIFKRAGKTMIRIFKVPAKGEKAEKMLAVLKLGDVNDKTT